MADSNHGLRYLTALVAGCVLHFCCSLLCQAFRWRDDDVWVFGARGGDAFADNTKYLYLHTVANHPEIRAVWLSKNPAVVTQLQNRGYEAYHAYSLHGLVANLRAGVVLLTQGLRDVNFSVSGGAETVMLWHGIPLKRISWDAQFQTDSLPARLAHAYMYHQFDRIVVPSAALVEPFTSAFRASRDRVVVGDYPRTDAFFHWIPGVDIGVDNDALRTVEQIADSNHVFLYMPTFRQETPGSLDDQLDLDALEAFLSAHDAYLFVKSHPAEPLAVDGQYDRIISLPSESDVYPFLRHVDVLVTDYSSVFFDFLLVDRPIVFYPYDLQEYRADRGFYFDYDDVTPGPVAGSFSALLDVLEETTRRDAYADDRRAVRNRFFATPQPGQAERTFQLVRSNTAHGRETRPRIPEATSE